MRVPRLRFLHRRGAVPAAVVALLAVHTALLAWSAYVHSPVMSEVGHLPAGISHWQFGRFDLYRVNPPLVRMVAALPVMLTRPALDWKSYGTDPLQRNETSVGIDFVNANGFRSFWLYAIGRWACIPFSLLGALVCYRWAKDLYGVTSGLAALVLWCFCPNILGNGAMVMPDVPASALGAAACYTFWRWLKSPTWAWAAGAGVVLGLAELTKTTLLVFYPLLAVLWIAYRALGPRDPRQSRLPREAAMIAAVFAVSIYVLNLGYGFEGSLRPLGEFAFKSRALTGILAEGKRLPEGNRFAESWLARVPVPLPANYVQGIDAQKVDFERGIRSYLRGEWSDHGWWYFYLYAAAIKVPLGTLLLLAMAVVASFRKSFRIAALRDEMFLLAPAVVLLTVVSSQTGFSIHFRYVLPIFPFAFIWASKCFAAAQGDPPSPSGRGRVRANSSPLAAEVG